MLLPTEARKACLYWEYSVRIMYFCGRETAVWYIYLEVDFSLNMIACGFYKQVSQDTKTSVWQEIGDLQLR